MPASRAGGPRRVARRAYQQGEGPLSIPQWTDRPPWEWATPSVGAGHARESDRSG
jgi:hypothetical protein